MIKRILTGLFILISAVLILTPFLWMISISLKPANEVYKFPPSLFSSNFTLSNIPAFFKKMDFLRVFCNTVFVAVVIGVVSTITSAMAGYAFAKYDFKGRNVLFLSMIATVMIPIFVMLIPLYIMMVDLGWHNSYKALIIPFLANPMGIFMMRQFIFSFPDELMHASRLDGCSEAGIFFRIVTPSIMPAMASLFILTLTAQWDSILWPAIMVDSQKLWVISVALATFSRAHGQTTNMNLVMVGSFISIIPILISFLSMQRFFISSITMAGFKE